MMPHQIAEQSHTGPSVISGVPSSVSMQPSVNQSRHRDPRRQEEVQVKTCYIKIAFVFYMYFILGVFDHQDLRKFGNEFKLPPEVPVGVSVVSDTVHNVKPPSVHQDVRETTHKGPPQSDSSKGQSSPDQHPAKAPHSQELNKVKS